MKTNVTQIIILGIFILFLVTGVIIFAKFGSNQSTSIDQVQVEIWGTLPESVFSNVLDSINTQKVASVFVTYREIPLNSFEQTLIESLADGIGPDAVIIPNTLLLKNQKKFTVIGYDVLSERDFKDTFVEGSEALLTNTGTFGIPLLVDPLVMYWNRDILTSKNVARPPATWEEVLALTERLTEKRADRSILKSTVALGDYANIWYAKDILLALTMQAGGSFVGRDMNGQPVNLLETDITTSSSGNGATPFSTAMTFYTQFSDPLKAVYSWNRSLPTSKDAFINGDLAFYFGHSSDAVDIRSKNPNLNFDIASLPQPKNSSNKITTGNIYSFSILATSKNQQSAYGNIIALASGVPASLFSEATGLPPAQRSLLSNTPGSAFGDVFWQSALWTKTWLDPNPQATDSIFASGINDVVTGKLKAVDSAKLISRQVSELLK